MARAHNLPETLNLIGMPGAGKSTVGVILAKRTGLRFCDTDLDIQVHEGSTLQDILEQHGYEYLRAVEQEVLLAIDLEHAIIATGGSVVYSQPAIARLGAAGPVVYLAVDLPVLEQRVNSAPLRGIASSNQQSFADVYAERAPLYQRYADITIDASKGTAEQIATQILQQLDIDA